MKEKLYTIAFSVIVTAVFGIAVSSLHASLREKTEMNSRLAEQRILLDLAGVDLTSSERTPEDILQTYTTTITSVETVAEAQPYIYFQADSSSGKRIIFPLIGRGFWDTIRGYMCVSGDLRSISGIRFVQHSETPGLGARIEEKWFTDQFVGKPLGTSSPDGDLLRLVSPGSSKKDTDVDAITGATETSRSVQRLLNASIRRFLSVYSSQKETTE